MARGYEGADRPQDPIVERLRPDPAQPAEAALALSGFLGDSDRPGFRRLYFTRDLDYYAEFRTEDVLLLSPIPAEEAPFPGDEATRVTLRRDATFDYTRTRKARPVDDFDLDLRLGALASVSRMRWIYTDSCELGCPPTGSLWCNKATDATCAETCQTCDTRCGTCLETCPNWSTCVCP
jgi:hypothetical protein